MRVAGRQQAAASAVEIAGNVEAAQQRDGLVVAARGPDLLAEEDGRALGLDQDLGELLDVVRDRRSSGRGAIVAGLAGSRALSTAISRSSTSRGISR